MKRNKHKMALCPTCGEKFMRDSETPHQVNCEGCQYGDFQSLAEEVRAKTNICDPIIRKAIISQAKIYTREQYGLTFLENLVRGR